MVVAWIVKQPDAVGARALLWFGHGCNGNGVQLERGVKMVWPWMLWKSNSGGAANGP